MPTTTIPVITNSTLTTTPTWGQFQYYNYTGLIVFGIVVVIIVMYFVWKRIGDGGILPSDYVPTVEDYDSEGVSINMVSLVQLIMVLPALGAAIWASMNYAAEPVLSATIAAAIIAFQFGMIAEMRRRTREKHSGMKVVAGWMRTKDGRKRKYYWRNVEILTERRLPDEDYELIEKETNGNWTKARLDQHHIYPFIIDNKRACYVITSAPESVAFEWVQSSDFDYWGDFRTQETGPELHEVTTVHRITNEYADSVKETYFQRDEYIHIFVTAWDDKRSTDYRGSVSPVDISRDEICGQIGVALGVQSNVTAGMINTDRQTLMNVLNDQRKLDAMANAIGSGMAAGIVADREAITMLDKIGAGLNWGQIIAFGVFFVFGTILGLYLG